MATLSAGEASITRAQLAEAMAICQMGDCNAWKAIECIDAARETLMHSIAMGKFSDEDYDRASYRLYGD